jgi:hypothetical protein
MTYSHVTDIHKDVLRANPGLAHCLSLPHSIIEDIAGRFIEYGRISPKQIALVYKLANQVYCPALPPEPKVPVVTGKSVDITGKVLSLKMRESQWGESLKMLIKDDRGFKVWGTVPKTIVAAIETGDRVAFTATVEASDDDETFGFAKRPRKAAILAA